MDCSFYREQLSAYLDGELEPALAETIRLHLDSCEGCRGELSALRNVAGLLGKLPRRKAPADLEPELLARIERDLLIGRSPARRSGVLLRRTFSGLAAAAVLFVVGFAAYLHFFPGAPAGPTLQPWAGKAEKSAIPGPTEHGMLAHGGERAGGGAAGMPGDGRGGDKFASNTDRTGPADGKNVALPAKPDGTLGLGYDYKDANGKDLGLLYAKAKGGPVPEVKQLVLASADVTLARKEILALARSLNIQAIEPAGDVGAVREPPLQPAQRETRGDDVRKRRMTQEEGEGYGGEQTPDIILVVDEKSLPELVGRLVSDKGRSDIQVVTVRALESAAKAKGTVDSLADAEHGKALAEKRSQAEAKDVPEKPAAKPAAEGTETAGPAPAEGGKAKESRSTTPAAEPAPTARTPARPGPGDEAERRRAEDLSKQVKAETAPAEAETTPKVKEDADKAKIATQAAPPEQMKRAEQQAAPRVILLHIYLRKPAPPIPAKPESQNAPTK